MAGTREYKLITNIREYRYKSAQLRETRSTRFLPDPRGVRPPHRPFVKKSLNFQWKSRKAVTDKSPESFSFKSNFHGPAVVLGLTSRVIRYEIGRYTTYVLRTDIIILHVMQSCEFVHVNFRAVLVPE